MYLSYTPPSISVVRASKVLDARDGTMVRKNMVGFNFHYLDDNESMSTCQPRISLNREFVLTRLGYWQESN
jgi:hypothetical protein